jgi:hypothetical protein
MSSNDDVNPERARPTIRIPWGATLLLAPHAVLAVTTRRDRAFLRPASAVLRVLGARHLLQAGFELRWPTAQVLTAAAAVDGIHAATGVAFGLLDHRWRRAALLDAAIAAGFCLATARSAGNQPHRPQLRST